MFELDKISIYKAVINTFNKDEEKPFCSAFEIEHDEETTLKMIFNNLQNIYCSKNMKWAIFKENSEYKEILEELDADLNMFLKMTENISYKVHNVIHDNREVVSSCNIAFVLFEMDNEMYLGFVKLNHKDLFIRKIEESIKGITTMISKSNDLYLNQKQKIEEGLIINLKTMEIALLDKSYNINGDKINLLEHIFKLDTRMSDNEKLKCFNQVNKRIQDKFIGEDINQKIQIKKVISDSIIEDGFLDIEKVIDKAFDDGQEIKSIYKDALKTANIYNQNINLSENDAKKFYKQKIITSEGLEISIPIDFYQENSRLKLVSNDDGTVDIVIKNVEEYKVL